MLALSFMGCTPMRERVLRHDDGRVEKCSGNAWMAGCAGPIGALIGQDIQKDCINTLKKQGFKEAL